VKPADLLDATDFALSELRPLAERDWSVPAGTLEWDVAFTVAHVAAHMTKATTYLASAATRWSPLVNTRDSRATNDQLLDSIEISARALAFVATHVGAATRAFHAWGMGDASAFLARAANEVLVHGWDVASGLGVTFTPPPNLVEPVLRRRLPWVAADEDPWLALLRAEGRIGDERSFPVESPLDDWNGTVPDGSQPPAIAWEWNAGENRWVPTYP